MNDLCVEQVRRVRGPRRRVRVQEGFRQVGGVQEPLHGPGQVRMLIVDTVMIEYCGEFLIVTVLALIYYYSTYWLQ